MTTRKLSQKDKFALLEKFMALASVPFKLRCILWAALDRLNVETQRCDPSMDDIGKRVGLTGRTARVHMHALARAKLVAITGRPGKRSTISFPHPDEVVDPGKHVFRGMTPESISSGVQSDPGKNEDQPRKKSAPTPESILSDEPINRGTYETVQGGDDLKDRLPPYSATSSEEQVETHDDDGTRARLEARALDDPLDFDPNEVEEACDAALRGEVVSPTAKTARLFRDLEIDRLTSDVVPLVADWFEAKGYDNFASFVRQAIEEVATHDC